MKASEILEYLNGLSGFTGDTVDTFKAGSPDTEVTKAAVCFIATPKVIRAAHEWGAELLITHEPTYHDHFDRFNADAVENGKKELIESTRLALFRYHDHAHRQSPDLIHAGFCDALGYDINDLTSGKIYVNPVGLAKLIEEKTGVKHVRICGNRDLTTNKIGLFLGACGSAMTDPVRDGTYELIVCGEVCEWQTGEYIRDAAELGKRVCMLTLGHAGSERDGMKYISRLINRGLGVETRYFECGEVYTYTEG